MPFDSGYYCAKCDTSCLTCAGPGVNECSTCPDDFTLESATSTCIAPRNDTVNTVASNYHSYNFEQEPQWVGGSGVYSCGLLSVLQGASGTTIYTSLSLAAHYKIRVLAAFYSFASNSDTFTHHLKTTADAVLGSVSTTTPLAQGDFSSDSDQTFDYYSTCPAIYATNLDAEITDGTL